MIWGGSNRLNRKPVAPRDMKTCLSRNLVLHKPVRVSSLHLSGNSWAMLTTSFL